METILHIEDLRTYFFTEEGISRAVDGITLSIPEGKTVALVGESGCGKTMTALSILRLIPEPAGKIVGGRIIFEDTDLIKLPEKQMQKIRGNKIAMIFQEPMSALNPVFTIGDQIIEAIRLHRDVSMKKAKELAIELLDHVGIPNPEDRLYSYPHQLSGGMRQRAMIAMALACKPKLLIADEPTTALDVTIQAQILSLLAMLQTQLNMSILLITHDLGVVAQIADYVAVMYAGKIVEEAAVDLLFSQPLHPYTQGLLAALPRLSSKKERLAAIPGQVPNPINHPPGCRFQPRCPIATKECQSEPPQLQQVEKDHSVACWQLEIAKKGIFNPQMC